MAVFAKQFTRKQDVVLTFMSMLFWQKYIQLTTENLQRSLSISTAICCI
ncbi:MAG: hypothetical protein RMY36_031690 [Nostoc sp. SerVER01]